MRDIQNGSAFRLKLVRVIDGWSAVEHWFHRKFSKQRLHGEWFTFCSAMLTVSPPGDILVRRRPYMRTTKDGNRRFASTIYLREAKDRKAKQLAKRKGVSKSSVLVRILEEYLK